MRIDPDPGDRTMVLSTVPVSIAADETLSRLSYQHPSEDTLRIYRDRVRGDPQAGA